MTPSRLLPSEMLHQQAWSPLRPVQSQCYVTCAFSCQWHWSSCLRSFISKLHRYNHSCVENAVFPGNLNKALSQAPQEEGSATSQPSARLVFPSAVLIKSWLRLHLKRSSIADNQCSKRVDAFTDVQMKRARLRIKSR